MSASGGGAAPPDPQVEEALSRMEPAGAILPLWITMAVFGNLFAVAFLIHGLLLYMPRLRRCGAHTHAPTRVRDVLASARREALSCRLRVHALLLQRFVSTLGRS